MKAFLKYKSNFKVLTKEVPIGYSFKNLFFGFWVPLFRRDLKGYLIQFFSNVCSLGISSFIFPFFYNARYIKYLMKKGYELENKEILDKIKPLAKWKIILIVSLSLLILLIISLSLLIIYKFSKK